MHADHAMRVRANSARKIRDTDARSVRRQHRVRWEGGSHLLEDLLLDLHVLSGSFNGPVRTLRLGHGGHVRDALRRGVCVRLLQLALLHRARERLQVVGLGLLQLRRTQVNLERSDARLRGSERDAGTHGPGSDDGDGLNWRRSRGSHKGTNGRCRRG